MSRKEMKEPEIERFVDFAKELSALSEKHGISLDHSIFLGVPLKDERAVNSIKTRTFLRWNN